MQCSIGIASTLFVLAHIVLISTAMMAWSL